MYRRTVQLSIALAIALVVSGFGPMGFTTLAQASEPANSVQPKGDTLMVAGMPSEQTHSPNEQFQNARENFLKKDLKASANDIRKSAAFLRRQAASAAAEGKKGLVASAKELDKLADGVEKGTVTSVKALDNAFAKARQALSKHNDDPTQYQAEQQSKKGIGHTLKWAATGVGNGLVWTGQKVKSGTVKVAHGTVNLGGKIIKGTGELAKGAVKTVGNIGGRILRLGKKKPQPATS